MNLQGKKLLILGAANTEKGVVKAAKALGVYTIVTDYNTDFKLSPAKSIADEVWYISWSDVPALKEKCREREVDGVLAGYSEFKLKFALELCRELSLPFYVTDEVQLHLMSDKALFKETCRKYGVPVVEEFDYQEEQKTEFRNIPLPVVVKPVDNGGSVGISVCHTYDDLLKGIEKALENSKSRRILIEKYMTGEEVVIYYTFQDGKPILTAMCDRYTNKEQAGMAQLPTSYIYPSRHLAQYIKEADAAVKRMFCGLGIQNGVMFLQSFVEEDGSVRIYEPGFRLNGAQEHNIVRAISGVDTRDCMIHFALTGSMADEDLAEKINPVFGKYGCKLSPLVKEGKIAKLDGLKEIEEMPEVVAIAPSYQVGDTVKGSGTLKQIICRFFVVADTKEELKTAIDRLMRLLVVEDGEGSSMLLTPFDTNLILENY